ncbi:ribonucleoside-triphosphate reductase [Gallibacterium salpingitidis]|uniref:Ribonucleoside-triphosphate reductase n=1 Tax=Gallibacterium salpingitidis TaxID=505341 RepID=A0AB36E3H1_9PAST|nr:ATP-binding protein [Gallibacterium salpingitidis]OBX10972.1 ribonucleoside-triphosphate reductase [Gallibacterium salpingitidis]WKS99648.1 ATP-binding protein [Gallibacterium salpingitidis]
MLHNPYKTNDEPIENKKLASDKLFSPRDTNDDNDNVEQNSLDLQYINEREHSEIDSIQYSFNDHKYNTQIKINRPTKRNVEKELTDEEYHQRLIELNTDSENKHYVLFFGQPASGKTWIIGSILHYMKNYLDGLVYLDTNKSTENEEELFYILQDRFNGVIHAEKITSTDTKQYFEFHIAFTPKDSNKPPINIVFIDASGEHSEQGFMIKENHKSGKLPNYLMAILESNVKTKLIFVYDQSLVDQKGSIPQMNVLNAVFTHIQNIQNVHKKFFPKALLLSKADRIYSADLSSVEKCGFDPMIYAIEKIPSFANSFFNESPENKTIFYRMGDFSLNSDLLTKFDKECPEKLFRWLYMTSTNGVSPIKEQSCWDKFLQWFKGK